LNGREDRVPGFRIAAAGSRVTGRNPQFQPCPPGVDSPSSVLSAMPSIPCDVLRSASIEGNAGPAGVSSSSRRASGPLFPSVPFQALSDDTIVALAQWIEIPEGITRSAGQS
jgi:hypothetical protein